MRTDLDDGRRRRVGGGSYERGPIHDVAHGIGEAAGYLSVPPSTLTTWAYGYER